MPAGFCLFDNEPCYIAYKKLGWHNSGTLSQSPITAQQAKDAIHTFHVHEGDTFAGITLEDGTVFRLPVGRHMQEDQTLKSRWRLDKSKPILLGTVGSGNHPIQYDTVLDLLEAAFDKKGEGFLESAGILGNGERMFATVDLGTFSVGKRGDDINRYLAVHTSHDGKWSLDFLNSTTRIVCQNTCNAALRKKGDLRIKIRHTSRAEHALQDAKGALERGEAYFGELQEAFNYLEDREVKSTGELDELVEEIFPFIPKKEGSDESPQLRKRRKRVKALFDGEGEGVDLTQPSRWRLFNSYTQWVDREQTTRGDTNRKLRSVFTQSVEQERGRVLQLLLN